MLQSIKYSEAKTLLTECLKARLVPFLTGSPGIGKSALAQELADHFELKLIDFRLSQADPTDLNGFPSIDPISKIAYYAPMDTFPTENTPLPSRMVDDPNNPGHQIAKQYKGWLLFLDEFNSASLAVQKATYKLVLDHMVGQHKLHPNVVKICAGNLQTDNAITSRLSTAMQSRLIHLELRSDPDEWLKWANKCGLDYRITSYIEFQKDHLNMFQKMNKDKSIDTTFPCERTWEFTHKLIKNIPDLTPLHTKLVAGAIGEGCAQEFVAYTKVFNDLPNINDILTNPNSAKVPTTMDCKYAVTGLLAANSNMQNMKQICAYAARLDLEFTTITYINALRRDPALLQHESMQKFVEENYRDLNI